MLAVSDIRQVLIFRALMAGDLLCATPALRALRAAVPHAQLVLCGLPPTAGLARRLGTIDEFLPFPGHPALPEKQPAPGELEDFIRRARLRRFDLVMQMHGSGGIVNALVTQFGGRTTIGFALPGTETGLDLAVPWPGQGTELERCLALTDALGAPRKGLQLDFPLLDSDRREAARLLSEFGVAGRYMLLHPGSQLPSRRWAPESFAAVADAVASRGLSVILTGVAGEATLASAVRARSRHRLTDLVGRTRSLHTLGALVESAALVVSNDTSISHIAAALSTPSVVVACGSDVARWAPLNHDLHRVHWHETPCRPCAHAVCPTAHECAVGVLPMLVADSAVALLTRFEAHA